MLHATEEQPQESADAPPTTGTNLGCFLAQERICGPDCMAYLPQVPEGEQFKGEQWAHCHLLVNADRTGRHIVVLANLGTKLYSLKSKASAEEARKQPPPGVTG